MTHPRIDSLAIATPLEGGVEHVSIVERWFWGYWFSAGVPAARSS